VTLTPAAIAELRRLLAAATPGPWEADLDGNANGEPLIYGQTRDWWIATLHPQCLGSLEALRLADAALIVALRNAAPALLDAADEAERLRARALLPVIATCRMCACCAPLSMQVLTWDCQHLGGPDDSRVDPDAGPPTWCPLRKDRP